MSDFSDAIDKWKLDANICSGKTYTLFCTDEGVDHQARAVNAGELTSKQMTAAGILPFMIQRVMRRAKELK